MKKITAWILVFFLFVSGSLSFAAGAEAAPEPDDLYARSACLMDGRSGRILFGKNEDDVLPMASTTKIMTCIIALENADMSEIAAVSANAAAQPEVKLGAAEGDEFYLKDLLYSLMLESHNDSAVIIAEQVAGSVAAFTELMNEKAESLGCEHTHYVTPNGLDAEDGEGAHGTTAAELARVMAYCVNESPQREQFLSITQARSHTFTDVAGTRSYSCSNHNSLLDTFAGVISGKTGFTSAAGYCYVCALEDDGRLFTVALLACGWPYNRSYKWSDARKLLSYGMEHYVNITVDPDRTYGSLPVADGLADPADPWAGAYVELEAAPSGREPFNCLLGQEEHITVRTELKKSLQAPLEKGEPAGQTTYWLGEECLRKCSVVTKNAVKKRELKDWLIWAAGGYLL